MVWFYRGIYFIKSGIVFFPYFFILSKIKRDKNVFTSLSWNLKQLEMRVGDKGKKGYKCLHFIILKWTIGNDSKGQSLQI